VTPASGTDFIFNDQADGLGTDVTADCTVTAVYSSNSAVLTVTNNSGATAYAGGATANTTLQVRGLGVYAQERVAMEASDSTSINLIGENVARLNMPYLQDLLVAQDFCDFHLHVALNDDTSIKKIPLLLMGDDEARALTLAQAEISDRISVTETQTGLAAKEYYINAVDFAIDAGGQLWLFWYPITADTSKFWFLGTAGLGELNQTTWLGFDYVV